MRIIEYINGCLKFYCEKCDFYGEYDINNLLEDNCTFKVVVVCELCNDFKNVYILRCKDQSESLRLNAEFQNLKEKDRYGN